MREWEEDDYVKPDYTLSSTVESLHGWIRVAGDNEFDLSERDYGEDAVPFARMVLSVCMF